MTGSSRCAARRHATLAALTVLGLAAAQPASAAAKAITVSSPPILAGTGFTVNVKGASGALSMYLSPQRKLIRGDISLGRARVTHGKVKLRVPASTRPGGYFVLACTGSGRRRRCGASKGPTVVLHRPSATSAPVGVSGAATADPGSATSGTLSAGGGELTATGPEGTRYTLVYNAGSALEGTQITLVPITSLSGAGVGRLAGGVEIEPEGIDFAHGAALLASPAHAVAPATRVALAFGAGGQSIHRTTTAPILSRIIIPVGVSGGFAVAGGGAFAAAARAHSAGRRPLARAADAGGGAPFYENLFAQFLHELLATGASYVYPNLDEPASKTYEAAVVATLEEWYDEITLDRLPSAKENDQAAESTLQELARWGQQGAQLLGDGHNNAASDGLTLEGMQRIFGMNWEEEKVGAPERQITEAAYERHQKKCGAEYSGEEQQRIVTWAKRAALYGTPDDALPSVEEVYACTQFTLEFESTMDDRFLGTAPSDPKGEYIDDYTAKVKLKRQFTVKGEPIGGSASGSYAKAEGSTEEMNECNEKKNTETSRIVGGTPGTVVVSEFTPPPTSSAGSSIKLELAMPQENLLVENSVCEPRSTNAMLLGWWADWGSSHASAVTGFGPGGLQFTFALAPDSASSIGQVSFTGTATRGANLETAQVTEIKVQHTPGPWSKL